MASNTGENEHGLKKITDMTRLVSLIILGVHFYYFCYGAFDSWHWTSRFSDRVLSMVVRTGLFVSFNKTKWLALLFLLVSLVGIKGKKDEKLQAKQEGTLIAAGLTFYFASAITLS